MLKIAVTGPESTGKSTIAENLAQHYKTVWVPEYARTYIGSLNRPYTLNDIEEIAKGQRTLEKEAEKKAGGLLISDTDMLVLKIWSEHAFGKCPALIQELLAEQTFNLYLLMGVDMPWEPDPQREHPHLRQFFHEWYRRELETRQAHFTQVSGSYEERFRQACQQIDALLKQNNLT